jgi:hypothetical protein
MKLSKDCALYLDASQGRTFLDTRDFAMRYRCKC